MSKYQGLGDYLRRQSFDEVPMTFSDIEQVTGTRLPPKAQHHRAWWSNSASNSVMTKVWLDAGFRSERVDMAARKLVFKRIKHEYGAPSVRTQHSGMAEPQSAFKHEKSESSKPPRSPLWGALKGTFTIEPGYDLAQSPFTQEELDAIDANLERTADLIDAGMRKSK